MKAIEKRLQALESSYQSAGSSDPVPVYHWLVEQGHEAPEPLDGESFRDWLARLPNEALQALMDARDTNVET